MKLFLSLIIFMAINIPSYAESAYDKATPQEKTNYHKTLYFNLKIIGSEEIAVKTINRQMIDKLPGIKNLQLLPEKEQMRLLNKKKLDAECYERKCAYNAGKLLSADRVITGELKAVSYKKYEKVDKYIDSLFSYTEYSVKIKLFDINSNKEIAVINESVKIKVPLNPKGQPIWSEPALNSFKEKKINQLALNVIAAIAKYYKVKKYSPAENIPPGNHIYSISLSPSLIFPSGLVTNVFNPGSGFDLGLNIKNVFADRVNLYFTIDYYLLFWNTAPFDSFQSVKATMYAGYDFNITQSICILPMAGFGYHAHAIRFLPNDSYKFYYDPQITFKTEISYLINDRYSIILSPLYTCFFEKNHNGTYYGIDAGIKYKLN